MILHLPPALALLLTGVWLFAAWSVSSWLAAPQRQVFVNGLRLATPPLTPWSITCYVLAVPIVLWFAQPFYEGVAVIGMMVSCLVAFPLIEGAPGLVGLMDQVTKSLTLDASFNYFLVYMLVFVPLLFVGTIVMIIVLIMLIPILLVSNLFIGLPALVALWLAVGAGPLLQHVLDPLLVWYVGTFFYGVLFPLLWKVVEPLLAHTLGEIAFQRAQARVFGDSPRYAQPFYMILALVGIVGGGARTLAPVVSSTSSAVGTTWHENVSNNLSAAFVAPTPRPWPKVFTVAPRTLVATGVYVADQQEVGFRTTADVIAEIGSRSSTWIPKTVEQRTANVGIEPTHHGSWVYSMRYTGAPVGGDLRLRGGSERATVEVYGPPARTVRHWLAAGEVYRPTSQRFKKGDAVGRCAGQGLSFRMVDGKRTSRWQELDSPWSCGLLYFERNDHDFVPMGGRLELRADHYATWVESVHPGQ